MQVSPQGFLTIDGARLEYAHAGPQPCVAPVLVLLHEGLGSRDLWGDFAQRLQAATGAGVFSYSRGGYGKSDPVALPRPLDYMQHEALRVLPQVLDAIGARRIILVGHSDGASIATIYAGGVQDHRVRGLSLIAPHFICEDASVRAIKQARQEYDSGGLRAKLAKHHAHPDIAFNGWCGAWLDPAFRAFDISESLAYIRVPVQIVQGSQDAYGTARQIEIAQEECYCPVDPVWLEGIGHAPHREAPDASLAAIAEFVNRLLAGHGEGRMGAA